VKLRHTFSARAKRKVKGYLGSENTPYIYLGEGGTWGHAID